MLTSVNLQKATEDAGGLGTLHQSRTQRERDDDADNRERPPSPRAEPNDPRQ
jgi:hypothetical protein